MFLILNHLKREKIMAAKTAKENDTDVETAKRTFNFSWINAANTLWFLAGAGVGFIGHVLMTSAGVDDSDDSDIE
jgi:hypothetical protein